MEAAAEVPQRPRTLDGRVAMVTGAGGALGKAIVAEFTARGAAVVGVDLAGEGCLRCDISSAKGNREAVDFALDKHGRLDILVLNAGTQHMAPIPDFPEERWRGLLDVMLTGPFLSIQAAWGALTARPGSRVLFTASTSSFEGERFKAAYVAAKHGVLGLVKVTALEGAEFGLTANAVAPSWMRTPMVEGQVADRVRLLGKSPQEVIDELVEGQTVKRFIEPSEVAVTLAFLASEDASAITGACVPVDLGALA